MTEAKPLNLVFKWVNDGWVIDGLGEGIAFVASDIIGWFLNLSEEGGFYPYLCVACIRNADDWNEWLCDMRSVVTEDDIGIRTANK